MQRPDTRPDLSLSGFLSFLYAGFEEGYIYVPTLDRETGKFSQTFVKVSNLSRLEKHIRESSVETDVYLAPAVFREPRVSKETFAGSNVVWAEFDGNSPSNFKHFPSVVVQSSLQHHTHCYWRLDEPVTNAFDLEEINRALAFTLDSDKSGWDCTQILRPPETLNHKRGLPVEILELTDTIYNIGAFSDYKAPDRIDDSTLHFDHIPDVQDVIFKHAFSKEFKDVFTSNPPEGRRSTAYVHLGYLAAEAGCSNEELFALLINFDSRIGKYSQRQDSTRRIIDIIERVRLKYPLTQNGVGESEDSDSLEIYDIVSFGNTDFQVEWLLPGLLQRGGNMVLCSPPGVGKTQLALNFAYGLTSNTPVLGYGADRPCRVLFVSCEMGPSDLKYFTDQITPRYKDNLALLQENLFVLPLGEPLYLSTPAGQDKLYQLAEALNLDGVIFDSLGSATHKSLNDEEATKSLLDFNDRFRKNMDVFTWYIHHNRKATENNKEPSGLADVYGTQYITARATSVLSLWPVKRDVLKVRELKIRLAPEKDDWFIKRHKGLEFKIAEPEDITTTITSSKIRKVTNNDGGKSNNPFGI